MKQQPTVARPYNSSMVCSMLFVPVRSLIKSAARGSGEATGADGIGSMFGEPFLDATRDAIPDISGYGVKVRFSKHM